MPHPQPPNFVTGVCPPQKASTTYTSERSVSKKEKIDIWFIEPLERMKADDGFAFMLMAFPLLETIIRYELSIPPDTDLTFSHNSPQLKWFAKFMAIPDSSAREVWDAFRNGLLHRAMVSGDLDYELTGHNPDGRPAEMDGDKINIYVWNFRDRLVEKLKQHHKALWQNGTAVLPRIYCKSKDC